MAPKKSEKDGMKKETQSPSGEWTHKELMDEAALTRVRPVLLDVDAVPYVPQLFASQNPPKPGHTEVYRSYPPQPDIPRLDHLLPSTAAEATRARVAEALPGSESTEGRSPLVEKEAEGEARRGNSPRPSVNPPASRPEPGRQEIGTDPAASAAGSVTIAMAGTTPQAAVTPPPATSAMVGAPRAMMVKKAVMKKSSLSASAVKHKPRPAVAVPAPEPSALEGISPKEPAPEADTTLPDLPPPPKPQQAKARAGGEEQVEALDTAPADGIDDVEKLQKVITDTEQQFADCLRQVKTLGEKHERRQKELEDLRRAAQELVDMANPPEEGETSEQTLLE
ncbi:protein IQ-DOMAIN 14-like [Panicum hallii]|uniref:protein IQ-DOMAIN 14-like n=1 Tax=Panicum hallii TaxID=206008 RepID=UPI000DF4DCF4|nr:protein IQ-DOMAIN 14-like [Panicum hallii]